MSLLDQNLIFDLDDTLIHHNIYFEQVLRKFSETLHSYFSPYTVSLEDIRNKQYEISVHYLETQGYSRCLFPNSLQQTYRAICAQLGIRPDQKMIHSLLELGHSIYEIKHEHFPMMHETLQSLASLGHQLLLYTAGDYELQLKKFHELNLAVYFQENFFIVQQKNINTLSKLMTTFDLNPKKSWMIGNSLRSDIMPALQYGLNAVYIPAPYEWSYSNLEIPFTPSGNYLSVASLNELLIIFQ